MPDTDPYLGVALERLQRLVEVGFTKTDGQNALILQRLDQLDGKHADLSKQVDAMETRLDELDKSAVTNAQLTSRTKLILTFVTALVAVIGGVFGAIQFFNS